MRNQDLALAALFLAPLSSAQTIGQEVVEQLAYVKASPSTPHAQFGTSIDMDQGVAVVSSDRPESGKLNVFEYDGSGWIQTATFGVARSISVPPAVAISGDTIVAGFRDEGVFVFRRRGSSWVEEAQLVAGIDTSSWYGSSVDIDGDVVVVGDLYESSDASGVDGVPGTTIVGEAGAAWVFQRSGSEWSEAAFLKAETPEESARFGASVAVSGSTVAVGEPFYHSGTLLPPKAGNVHVFTESAGAWSLQSRVPAPTPDGDEFGAAVALWGDTLAVGAPREDSRATGVGGDWTANDGLDSGAAYVYGRTGDTWSPEAYLKASAYTAFSYFGSAVTVGEDYIAVGAHEENSPSTGVNGVSEDLGALDSGAAYLFAAAPNWRAVAYIKASNTDPGDRFGRSVALDGPHLWIGAPYEDSAASGIGGNQFADSSSSWSTGAAYAFSVCQFGPGTPDLNGNGIADDCELDCNENGQPDDYDIASGEIPDVNGNDLPDDCEADCNENGIPDPHDILLGTSIDLNEDRIPDECQPDCNDNGIVDDLDLLHGTSTDADENGRPDECDFFIGSVDPSPVASLYPTDEQVITVHGAKFLLVNHVEVEGKPVSTEHYTPGGAGSLMTLALPPLTALEGVELALEGVLPVTPTVLLDVVPPSPPVLRMNGGGVPGLLASFAPATFRMGGQPGNAMFLWASATLEPSTIAGVIDLNIGANFANLVPLGAYTVQPQGWVPMQLQVTGLPFQAEVHFQAVEYDVQTGALPVQATNAVTAVFVL